MQYKMKDRTVIHFCFVIFPKCQITKYKYFVTLSRNFGYLFFPEMLFSADNYFYSLNFKNTIITPFLISAFHYKYRRTQYCVKMILAEVYICMQLKQVDKCISDLSVLIFSYNRHKDLLGKCVGFCQRWGYES